eukprot:GGOE01055005.1.p1 GENE.GGOE01055005.1~~GGOE01055005.1.p1  ORF type:complete len:119 (+),score=55.28 GGOE01055005.1:24-359(+)
MSQLPKQLKIKSGTLKRNLKDLEVAQREAAKELERLEKFKAEGKDGAALKQQQHCVDEAQAGVPEAKKRIVKAVEEVQEFLAQNGEAADIKDTEDLAAARELLTQAEAALK